MFKVIKNNRKKFLLIFTLGLTSITIFFIIFLNPASSVALDKREGIESFPDSYKPYLYELQEKYPNWSFTALYTGLDWNYVIDNENKFGVNLVPLSYIDRWKNTTPGQYNVEVDSGWVDSSRQAVEYSMDPRNFLNEVRLFQFEELTYSEKTNNLDGIEKILYGTEFYNTTVSYIDTGGNNITTSDKYSTLIAKAGQISQVSSYHLASRIKQEVGPFLSHSSISGIVSGYEALYNFYNIGATSSSEPMGAIINGLKYARNGNGASQSTQDKYLIPWNTKEKAITGGGIFIGSSYIHLGQDTVYLQKFHVVDNSGGSLFWHQYMTNVLAPYSESSHIYKGYLNSNLLSNQMSFVIPIYDNMPDVPVENPNINPNEYINDNTKVYADVDNTLNIRSLPSTSSEVITTVNSSDEMTRIKKGIQSGDLWDKVILENGIIGYAFQSYLQLVPDVQISNINLSLDNTTLNIGDSKILSVEILPAEAQNNEVEFISSNPNIAQVDSSGNILAIRSGTVTITVRSKENNVTSSIDLTVNSKVTDLILNTSELVLNINNTFKISSTVVPDDATNKNVTYSSSNSNIATVDNIGNITAISEGNATITVTTIDGNIQKTVNIFVTSPIPDNELSFDSSLNVEYSQINGFDYTDMSVDKIKSLITTIYTVEIYNYKNELLSDSDLAGTGSKIKILDTENNIINQFNIILYGDVNGDGKIDTIDLLFLQRHILDIEKFKDSFLISGNINKNGNNPSSIDSLLIQRHILELQIISQKKE